ncbi:MAG: DUF5320 domain-containing protein [Candidatus Pacearchaeota archaeon]|nr:DUF5320 domain-containing protein [Candidatus Pacearchaeota archaeon]
MPGMDGAGPQGLGPGTGWGVGPCMAGRSLWRGRGFIFILFSIIQKTSREMLPELYEYIFIILFKCFGFS